MLKIVAARRGIPMSVLLSELSRGLIEEAYFAVIREAEKRKQ
jgi:hypothetical protein